MATRGKILIVEDDENLRVALEDNLVDEDYDVTSTAKGKEGLQLLARGEFDLAILDIMLPDTNGYEVCREIRKKKIPVRVLMLTARTLESDLVEGFDAGADDYLSKPYRLRELLARVGALMRRNIADQPESSGPRDEYKLGEHTIDAKGRVILDPSGAEVKVTRTEFDLLLCLLRNERTALSREDILAQAWDPDIVVDPRTVDNFVSSLKKKLGWTKTSPYRIKTVRGVGYRLEID